MTDYRNCDAVTEAHWRDWLDWAEEQGVSVPEDDRFGEARARTWEGSQYVALNVMRQPETFRDLLTSGDLDCSYTQSGWSNRLATRLAEVSDEPGLHQALRCFRRREMIRIIWRDLAGWAALEETLGDLSTMANVCIRQTLGLLHRWACETLGTPVDAAGEELQLVVLAMGKLGAHELNLSSDIDLIFAYAEQGEVRDGPRALTNEQFFTRLGQRLVQALSIQTVDGFVFRVDTRLRPFGDSGPLAMNFDAMEYYYHSHAREWERYAMIKARTVTGRARDRAALKALLRPFVYRRYLDFGAIDSLRDLKAMIAKQLYRRGMDENIKLGKGGIREIEFIVQVFQLVRGGHEADLQIRRLRRVLVLLGKKGLLPPTAVDELDAAYCFLRLVENRLQAYADKQTHQLPQDPEARLRLARSMNFADWASFEAVLNAHRECVQGHFDAVFAPAQPDEPDEHAHFQSLWTDSPDALELGEALAELGFTDVEASVQCLTQFRETVARKGISSRGTARLAQVMPLVLQAAAGSKVPDLVLKRVLTVIEAVVRRTAYLAMLSEHPEILFQLARLASMSPWFTDFIRRHPLLLDELIDPRRLYEPMHRKELEAELDALLLPLEADDLEQQIERLSQFVKGNQLRVAAADLTNVIPLMVVSDYLTEIAEVALARVLVLADAHLRTRHGHPELDEGAETGFLILGYGKLGGIELGYGSDLDLVFLHGSPSLNAMTDGARPVSNEQYYNRLGQRIIHMLTTQTVSGAFYQVDTRLRPDGNQGMLVRSLNAFADYQASSAWTWEHQALVRARPVAGDAVLAERFAAVRREIICRRRDPQQLRGEVRTMREKMRSNLDRTSNECFDLKQGYGGIADIEFMVQYSVMRWAADHPSLADWSDNIRMLETLSGLALLPGECADELTSAYKTLRAAYHRSALQERPTMIPQDQLRDERAQVQRLWCELMED